MEIEFILMTKRGLIVESKSVNKNWDKVVADDGVKEALTQENVAAWTVHVYRENEVRVRRIDELGTESPMSRITSTVVVRIGTTFYRLFHWVRYQIRTESV